MNVGALTTDAGGELQQGDEFTSRGRTITEADLMSFSALTGDWHPQHADAEWAARSRFGGRVAHGMLVLSYALGLIPFDPEQVVALRGFDSATFKRPVAIGDTIRVRCRVRARRPLDDSAELVELEMRIVNQLDRVVALANLKAVCRRTPDAPFEPAPQDRPNGHEEPIQSGVGRGWPDESLELYGGEAFL